VKKIYFAYGSNLNLEQMAKRCPNARQLGALYIPNWKLVFRGVADIEPTRNNDDLLPCGIWEITKECEKVLDIYEGVKRGLYRKEYICGMMTYRMNTTDIFPPARSYFNVILQGYQDFGLNTDHLFNSLGCSHYSESFDDYSFEIPA
tara:strand:- start:1287 stop:1727 length:441 start_codon:yes stop_codon:yes gene_type:complete